MKNTHIPYTMDVETFRQLKKKGIIDIKNGKLVSCELLPEYDAFLKEEKKPLDNTLFKDEELPKKQEIVQPVSYNEVLDRLKELYKEKKAIFIPTNCPSSKNSKEIIQQPTKLSVCCKAELFKTDVWTCSKCKKPTERKFIPRLIMSKLCQQYIDNTKKYWISNRELFLSLIKDKPKPYFIGMFFIRESLHKWDFNNATALITDIMAYDKDREPWITDDNVDEIIPVFLGHKHNKEHPGTIITVLNENYRKDILNYL